MKIVFFSLFCFLAFEVLGADDCETTINVLYINGINNTRNDAKEAVGKIASVLDASANHSKDSRRVFKVEGIYNPTGFYGIEDDSLYGKNLSFRQDKMELFLEKVAEERYSQSFLKIASSFLNGKWSPSKEAVADVVMYYNDMTPGDNYLEDEHLVNDGDLFNTKKTMKEVYDLITKNGRTVIVAHSQGNLLANLIVANYMAVNGVDDASDVVRVVNVANTSKFSVNGLNLTHSSDIALVPGLSGLPSSGGNWYRKTTLSDKDILDKDISDFVVASPTVVAKSPSDVYKVDRAGHNLVKVYLSDMLVEDASSDDFKSGGIRESNLRFVDVFENLVYKAVDSFSSGVGGACVFKVQSVKCEVETSSRFPSQPRIKWTTKGYAISGLSDAAVVSDYVRYFPDDDSTACDGWTGSLVGANGMKNCVRSTGDGNKTNWTIIRYTPSAGVGREAYWPALGLSSQSNPSLLVYDNKFGFPGPMINNVSCPNEFVFNL